jgi:integrase
MKEIMEKHGVLLKTEYIFPILRKGMNPFEEKSAVKSITKLMNVKMKAICKELKIENATTYTARHSYATVLKRSGVSISFISDQLGHTNVRTTENYLASFEEDERIKNSAFLTAFV